ncbi:3-oxoacyl-ACP synthase III family protein [Dysgonomonas sp. ZJ709]|uniref:3-oxoacyl-ACP synthase III family protein n=1 Tax=Dysgonomonas sp. ZJ709 TaxID=2709797 RepID=UPI0013ED1DC8|nr:ketoacyl-ACP synthase III [Dysgonomonas sp. ZJ709]
MYINAVGYYIPEKRISNDYFTDINGLDAQWIYQRTGIKTRSRANDKETIDYMCTEAVLGALPQLPYNETDVDLIIFASYTPSDTVGTTAHVIQREFKMEKAKAFHISSACSSAINGMEIIQSFLKANMSKKALLICAERNSTYSDDADSIAGHLWGDAATAYFFSFERYSSDELEIVDITSQGLAHIGQGPKAVNLEPNGAGLRMPYGRDVFQRACIYLVQNTEDIITKNGYTISDLSYFIGHQANKRIINHVVKELGIPQNKTMNNIEELGNTGSTSALLVLAQNYDTFKENDLICISVFGGGYSAGTCLLKKS